MSEIVQNEVVAEAPKVMGGEIPDGEYIANLANYTEGVTKKGDGVRSSLEFRIKKGEYKTRALFLDLNLVNPSERAVEISTEQLNGFLKALGQPEFAGDRTRILTDDTVDDVIIVVKQKMQNEYFSTKANKTIPATMKSKIVAFKKR